jgi:hypothetical protein
MRETPPPTEEQRELQLLQYQLSETSRTVGEYARKVVFPAFEEALTQGIVAHLGVSANTDPRPKVAAWIGLALLVTARTRWLEHPEESYSDTVEDVIKALETITDEGFGDP